LTIACSRIPGDSIEEKGENMAGSITIRLPEGLQRELEKAVKAEKTSKSEIIREAIVRYLSVKRFQQLRRRVLPFAEVRGLLTDEDIFKAIS
jgi:Arc/MetJ-type ribon-helix-helix transcriptional regulator